MRAQTDKESWYPGMDGCFVTLMRTSSDSLGVQWKRKPGEIGGGMAFQGKSEKASFQKAVDLRNPGQLRKEMSVRNCESVKRQCPWFSWEICQWKSSVTRHQLSSTDCAFTEHTMSPQFPDFDTEFTFLAPLHSGISAVLPFQLQLPCRTGVFLSDSCHKPEERAPPGNWSVSWVVLSADHPHHSS